MTDPTPADKVRDVRALMTQEDEKEASDWANWASKAFNDIYERKFGFDVSLTLFMAATSKAHSHGLRDAAKICDGVYAATHDNTAKALAESIRSLIALNKRIAPT